MLTLNVHLIQIVIFVGQIQIKPSVNTHPIAAENNSCPVYLLFVQNLINCALHG